MNWKPGTVSSLQCDMSGIQASANSSANIVFRDRIRDISHEARQCSTKSFTPNLSQPFGDQGGFKNLQNRSRRRQSAHFSSIIGVLAPTTVGGYDFLKPPYSENGRVERRREHDWSNGFQ